MTRGGKYVDCTPSEELDPIEYVCTPQRVKYWAEGVENIHPWFIFDMEDSPFGGPIVPPEMTHVKGLLLEPYFSEIPFRMHTRYIAEHIDPVKVGEKVTIKTKILDNSYKRGRQYIDVEMIVYGEDGRKCIRCISRDVMSFTKEKED